MKTSKFLYGKSTEELKSMEEGLLDRIKAVVDANNHCNALLEGTI